MTHFSRYVFRISLFGDRNRGNCSACLTLQIDLINLSPTLRPFLGISRPHLKVTCFRFSSSRDHILASSFPASRSSLFSNQPQAPLQPPQTRRTLNVSVLITRCDDKSPELTEVTCRVAGSLELDKLCPVVHLASWNLASTNVIVRKERPGLATIGQAARMSPDSMGLPRLPELPRRHDSPSGAGVGTRRRTKPVATQRYLVRWYGRRRFFLINGGFKLDWEGD